MVYTYTTQLYPIIVIWVMVYYCFNHILVHTVIPMDPNIVSEGT